MHRVSIIKAPSIMLEAPSITLNHLRLSLEDYILAMLTFLTNDVSFSGIEVDMYFTRLKHENVDHLCVL